MRYCLFNGVPAIVEESADGEQMVRLACQVTVLSDEEVAAKWRGSRHNGHLTLSEFSAIFGREYRSVSMPYQPLYLSGIVTLLPADYWLRNIPKSWWKHKRLPNNYAPNEVLS